MKERSHFMTSEQKAKWAVAESLAGRKLPRTHENCMHILGRTERRVVNGKEKIMHYPGPSRPGKTAKDKSKGR